MGAGEESESFGSDTGTAAGEPAGGDQESGEGRTRRLPRAVREQQMLDAAVRIFGRHGYRAASMDEIAEVAGVSKPLVYLYLQSKENLFASCMRREADALMASLSSAVAPGLPADQQLWAGLSAFFHHTARHPEGWAVLHRQAYAHGEPFATEATRVRERLLAYVTALIGAAAHETHETPDFTERDLSGLAQALVGAAEATAAWANQNPDVSPGQAAATLMNFAWTGLGGLRAGARWNPPPREKAQTHPPSTGAAGPEAGAVGDAAPETGTGAPEATARETRGAGAGTPGGGSPETATRETGAPQGVPAAGTLEDVPEAGAGAGTGP